MPQQFSLHQRSCGILLHVTSLPGPHGCGDLGPHARKFADFLNAAGQTWWQTLPIGPIGPGDSPYSSPSAFAGNPLLIDLEQLAHQGLLTKDDLTPTRALSPARVNFPAVKKFRSARLRLAHDRFLRRPPNDEYHQFIHDQRPWLDDFCLYNALKRAHHGKPWPRWDTPTRLHRRPALRSATAALQNEIAFEQFVQFTFHHHWSALKQYCNRLGVGLIGDVPIFLDLDSADAWAHPNLFKLDRHARPTSVSGVPPDMFSDTGQKWGHPLYRWPAHAADHFDWWLRRLAQAAQRFDAVRIDHFLGLHRCWAVPPHAPTAQHGRWTPSPGLELLTQAKKSLGQLNVIAEDLGPAAPQALALRDRFGFLGMRVLQQAFTHHHHPDLPHRYPRRCAAYTATHDNDTTVGWFNKLSKRSRPGTTSERQRVLAYTGSDGRHIHRDLIRLLYFSNADLALVPMQDALGLGSAHKMNRPGTPTGNWRWRMPQNALTDQLANHLATLAHAFGRTGTFTLSD